MFLECLGSLFFESVQSVLFVAETIFGWRGRLSIAYQLLGNTIRIAGIRLQKHSPLFLLLANGSYWNEDLR